MSTVLISAGATACGSEASDGSSGTEGASQPVESTTTVPCPGDPIKVTAIATLSGPLSFAGASRDYREGTDAALATVNSQCLAGRPLEVEVCDDKSDPNESTACGRRAAENGSIALFGTVGTTDNGANAAGLPAVLTRAQTAFDILDEKSYPATSLLTLVMASVSAAAGADAKTMLFVGVDAPQTQAAVKLLTDLATELGISLDFLLYPPDTTDFTSIAAQIAERDSDAITLAVPSIVPFMSALDAEGITPADRYISAGVDVLTPDALRELGSKVDGVYSVSDVAPPQDSENPGIQQMLAEYKAAGINTDPKEMTTNATQMWSKVHILAETIGGMGTGVDTINSASLIDALVARGEVSRPEFAPFDYSKNAFPDIEMLSGFRVFGDQVMVIRIEDGTYRTVAPFADIRKPFDIDLDN
jgi:ABC-type branched-subunit amino acid transport system substrate-binding protein